MDPNTGKIYAMASVPSYDPSIFIPPQDPQAIEEVYKDPTQPIFPKALRADTPGSTFKPMTALAASTVGKAGVPWNCSGSVDYGRPIACWIKAKGGSHGTIGLQDGIKFSCNCFFMQMGNDAGIDSIDKVSALFGFGEPGSPKPSGIEVPDLESNGCVGSRSWWAAKGRGSWTKSETAYISMGQGLCTATPLQICMLAAAIGNGGKIYRPTLIDHYKEYQVDRDGVRKTVISEFKPNLVADLLKMGAKQRDFDNIREGMRRVVNEQRGTGGAARSEMCIVAGKTGTAQKKGEGARAGVPDNRTWFMSFAPYDKPTLAVVVMVMNGEAGGKVSAPIAKRIIEQTLGLWAGTYKIAPQPLEPAKGHFNKLDQVVYEGENVPAVEPQDEDSTTSDEEDTEAVAVVAAAANAPKTVPPKAQVIEEDDSHTMTRQTLQPVQFRMKTDPPNPPPAPSAAKTW
jgi:penicillin-binding protein 2